VRRVTAAGSGERRLYAGGRCPALQSSAVQTTLRSLLSPRLLLIALAVSAVLDYTEWVEHHPPVMAVIAVLHFVFAWVVLAIAMLAWRRFSR